MPACRKEFYEVLAEDSRGETREPKKTLDKLQCTAYIRGNVRGNLSTFQLADFHITP